MPGETEWGSGAVQGLCEPELVLMAELARVPALASIYVEPPVASAKRLCAHDTYRYWNPFSRAIGLAPMGMLSAHSIDRLF